MCVAQVGSETLLSIGQLRSWSHGHAAKACLVYRGAIPIMVDAPPGNQAGEVLEGVLDYVSVCVCGCGGGGDCPSVWTPSVGPEPSHCVHAAVGSMRPARRGACCRQCATPGAARCPAPMLPLSRVASVRPADGGAACARCASCRAQAKAVGLVTSGDRVVVSQCPRDIQSDVMGESGVVQLITVDHKLL